MRTQTLSHSKKCFVCGETKPLSEFYKHPAMKDGHLNKCKECACKDVQENRRKRLAYYRDYDRIRNQTEARIRRIANTTKQFRKQNPEKYRAHNILNNAVRDGKIIKPSRCHMCKQESKYIHAHHDDYSFPLKVRWLCPACHSKVHRMQRSG